MKRIVVCFDGTWNKPADEALRRRRNGWKPTCGDFTSR